MTVMMIMMMNYFVVWLADEMRLAFHCLRSSPLRISDTPRAGFEPAQKLSSGFFE